MNKLLIPLFALLASASFAQVSQSPGANGSFALKSNGSAPGAATGGLIIFEVDNAGVERRNVLAKLSDDFLGPSLGAVWTPVAGNAGVTPTIAVSDSGILSLTTVASSAAASATTQVGSELNWRAIRGNLVMETRLKMDTSSTQAVFAGFANSKAYISGGVVGVNSNQCSWSGCCYFRDCQLRRDRVRRQHKHAAVRHHHPAHVPGWREQRQHPHHYGGYWPEPEPGQLVHSPYRCEPERPSLLLH